MKKKLVSFITIFAITMLLIPNTAYAEVTSSGLVEAVNEEIEIFGNEESYQEAVEQLKNADLSNYEESDDKIKVYMFRGSSCSHCFDAIVFFASIANEYGKYFNFVSYEVWANKDNSALMEGVAERLGEEASGVPYIVIGKKSWSGFSDSMADEIKEAIKSEYDKKESERYDVITSVDGSDSNSNSSDIIAVIIILLVTGIIVFGIIQTRKNAS